MKKSLRNLLAITFSLSIILSACSKAPDKVLPKKDGLWTATYTSIETVGGASSTQTGAWSITFSEGTGVATELGFSLPFTWSYDKKNKTITITFTGSSSATYNVEEMKAKSEKWTRNYTETTGGITYNTNETFNLTKVD